MKKYIICENLKLKGNFIKKMVFTTPLLTAIMAFLFGGPLNMQNMIFYWWYIFFLPGIIAVSAALMDKNEKKASNYHGVYLLPINLKKVWISKNIILAIYLFLTEIIVFLMILLPKGLGFKGLKFSTGQIILGCILIWLSTLPQIPILLYVGKKLGFAVMVFINVVLNLVIPPFFANKSIWYLFPHCYCGKLMKEVIGLNINGICINPNINKGVNTMIIIFIISVILVAISLYFTAKDFSKQEVK